MSGRDLIIYILANELENTDLYAEDVIGFTFMDETEAAAKFEVGTATIRAWFDLGLISGSKIGETVLYYRDQPKPHIN